MDSSCNLWTHDDEMFLIDNYEILGGLGVSKKINRSVGAISQKIVKLRRQGITVKSTVNEWTDEEDDFIEKNHRKMRYIDMANALGRSFGSVQARVKALKITKGSRRSKSLLVSAGKNKHWVKAEEQYLIDNYGFKKNPDIADYLNKTARSVEGKARRMGLAKIRIEKVSKKHWEKSSERWTDSEEKYLIDNIGSMEVREIAFNLKRSTDSVWSKIRYMRLRRGK